MVFTSRGSLFVKCLNFFNVFLFFFAVTIVFFYALIIAVVLSSVELSCKSSTQ